MTVREKFDELISGQRKECLKNTVKLLCGGIAMLAGFKMYSDSIEKASENETLIKTLKAYKEGLDEDALSKNWDD